MRTTLILLAVIVAVFIFLCIIPIFGRSQEITGVSVNGTCRDFVISVSAEGLGESCWDVKLDVPGNVDDGGTWRSSFYYIDKAICWPDDEAQLTVRLESSEPVIEATAKLRQGSKVIERDFTISQSCNQPLPDNWVILVVFVVILVFGWSLAWWWKRK
ncbi:MAG: hypothetical protein JXC85_05700 [Candidatus Aenigmarchaeota archaeon]|nr:hypothetical protein [Candidatus Aenigmarchaeota archaeon]